MEAGSEYALPQDILGYIPAKPGPPADHDFSLIAYSTDAELILLLSQWVMTGRSRPQLTACPPNGSTKKHAGLMLGFQEVDE